MSLIQLNSVSITLSEPLFSDLTFTLNKSDRLGLIAANGQGKSTLLSLISGQQEPTSGDITTARGLRIGHVAQYVDERHLPLTLYELVLNALPPEIADYESWRVDVALDDLKVPYDIQHKPLADLSGGWQRTALLAAAWINEPDVLLLDEPTNHLDLGRIGHLQSWLKGLPKDKAVILTSHDRAFLDVVCNRTLFLRPENAQTFNLPYSKARDALTLADETDARRFANDLNKAQQLKKQAAKLKNIGINSGSDLLVIKTKQLTERAEKLEAAAKPAHKEKRAGDIKLTNSGTHAKALVAFDDVTVATPNDIPLYTTGQKWITRGDRVVVLGANGTGKSSLVRLVKSALDGHNDQVKTAASVRMGYSDQHLSQLNLEHTPMHAVTDQFDVGDQRARALLASAGMNIQMQDTKAIALSGGQRARLAMLILRLQNPNFYLLDEPTNHLDIEGQEALEAELCKHEASCLLVSHDRSFVRNVGNRFWQVQGKRLIEVDDPEAFFEQELSSADELLA